MAFSRQEFWSKLSFPSPGNLPGPGIKPMSPALAGRFFTIEAPGKPEYLYSGRNNLKDLLQSVANIMLDSSVSVTAHTQSQFNHFVLPGPIDMFAYCCLCSAQSLQLCLTLSDPMDCSLPSSSVCGIFLEEYWNGLPFLYFLQIIWYQLLFFELH
ncbi:unnamed protein product [Rangifer tarandus platyrhynchus]|uniref:Uncharacterized protein n=2 Tax=Rangifer tarandus platyrhynchus TaxID=3082113 RepID=A0AC59Z4L3_RANTA|nr:unnamed protein product [Rangifer tarandus platyrhynchus]